MRKNKAQSIFRPIKRGWLESCRPGIAAQVFWVSANTLSTTPPCSGINSDYTHDSCILHIGSSILKMETTNVLKKPFWLLIKRIFKAGEHEGKGHVCHNSCVPWHPVLCPVSHVSEKKHRKIQNRLRDEMSTRSDVSQIRQTTNE